MAYIDETYYTNTYVGIAPGPNDDLNQLIARACDTVDNLTNNIMNINSKMSYDLLAPFQQMMIQKAVASMVEFYIFNGGYENTINSVMDQVNVGGFSYVTVAARSQGKAGNTMMIPDNVVAFLGQSGLLYAGIYASDGFIYYDGWEFN